MSVGRLDEDKPLSSVCLNKHEIMSTVHEHELTGPVRLDEMYRLVLYVWMNVIP